MVYTDNSLAAFKLKKMCGPLKILRIAHFIIKLWRNVEVQKKGEPSQMTLTYGSICPGREFGAPYVPKLMCDHIF